MRGTPKLLKRRCPQKGGTLSSRAVQGWKTKSCLGVPTKFRSAEGEGGAGRRAKVAWPPCGCPNLQGRSAGLLMEGGKRK